MYTLNIITDPKVKTKWESYPREIYEKLWYLRSLILETAKECDSISDLEETLKWGEPSFLVKNGSTIRIDWKPKAPNQYAMYFKCTSTLVANFREVFGDTFNYENNRALIFNINDTIPVRQLKKCIQSALNYHNLKQLPKLGL